MPDQGLDLRGQIERVAAAADVEWLDADGVAGRDDTTAVCKHEGEHAVQMPDDLRPVGAISVQDGLGVASCPKNNRGLMGREIPPQPLVVVDHAVGDEGSVTIRRDDRLCTALGIDDRQTLVAQHGVGSFVHVAALAIGPAISQPIEHLADDLVRVSLALHEDDAAHHKLPLLAEARPVLAGVKTSHLGACSVLFDVSNASQC